MQLTKTTDLKGLLTTATCALLTTNQVSATETAVDEWQFDTAIMYYGESDRVTAVEGIVAGQKTFADEQVLNLKVTVDALTGASANGAVAQPDVQTFTRPSGNGQYQVKAKQTPLDDTFHDTRLQLTGSWSQPLYHDYTWTVGGNLSKEYDYLSVSVNSNLARDFNKKNTTVSAGFSYAFDQIEPEGGLPKALSEMTVEQFGSTEFDALFEQTRIGSSDDKNTLDLLLGLTQVINRNTIVQLNYSYSDVSGYLTDPFKVVSVVNQQGYSQRAIYEHRPDSRTKHAVFAQLKTHFSNTVLDASYRYMTDDWQIDSHTLDLRYHMALNNGHYIEPHIRYYTQTAAEFYTPFIIEGQSINQDISADYRIGEMDAYTFGIKYGMPMNSGDSLAFRLEYYRQSPKSDGTAAVGVLNDVELYETIDAVIAQVSYSF
ncbi:hypothetical protein tinsulaeT_12860 [Thalassotalea insulae]|uniref:DUF3570 domain-containing protein n=1 Tax=Thalassotalea insulae TaxID=2056778 RepID=A0ABQ6GUX0_9GAMM|nr:DUF3570 domain-containing protein [Thalassotalea insulae]GLX77946.1 hypothetical protein tinsulaeT_12860 [Thalassotalea insulae]